MVQESRGRNQGPCSRPPRATLRTPPSTVTVLPPRKHTAATSATALAACCAFIPLAAASLAATAPLAVTRRAAPRTAAEADSRLLRVAGSPARPASLRSPRCHSLLAGADGRLSATRCVCVRKSSAWWLDFGATMKACPQCRRKRLNLSWKDWQHHLRLCAKKKEGLSTNRKITSYTIPTASATATATQQGQLETEGK